MVTGQGQGGPGALPRIFSTCPQSRDVEPGTYKALVAEVSRWSEAAGCEGLLIYTDHGIVDPWLVAQLVVEATERLCPLVAVQPVYMHPYTVAKMVTSIASLHGRRVYLNLVAGGFRNDLTALGDAVEHDDRYSRLVEYTRIIKDLISGAGPVSIDGRFYAVQNLKLSPPVREDLWPGFMISGSSPAGDAAARALQAISVKYPQPALDEQAHTPGRNELGMRIGIVTRADGVEAWEVAHARFPEDRAGQITHGLAMRVSDSDWHHQLSELAVASARRQDPYWLGPFQNYQTFCPYLVGAHDVVAAELRRYIELGFGIFILDIPRCQGDLENVRTVFELATSDG